MNEIDSLREELLSIGAADESFKPRLKAFEDAVRGQEREAALGSVRRSLNTLRSLVAFLRQEVTECAGPLEKLCDELEKDVEVSTTSKS